MATDTDWIPDRQESVWIAAAQRGDRDAFARLVERYQHRVFKLSGRFFKRHEEVEDAAQETFLTVWRKLGTYKARAPFEHWLTRVCLNTCYGRFRKRKPETTGLELEHYPAPSPEAAAGNWIEPELAMEVEGLLGRLPPEDRFVLTLLYGEGWSVAEIADRLGWSSSKVKVRAHRARKKLRRVLEEDTAS